jgi:hypothetical protein
MSRYDLVKEMCRRVGLERWYATRLMANVISFEARTGAHVTPGGLARAVKYMSDNRQYLVPVP